VNKICILAIAFIFITASGTAQYRVNKLKYDYHDYTRSAGDRYDPIVAGVTSSLLPGLGQIISGEPGRGFVFMGAFAGCAAIYITGIVRTKKNKNYFFVESGINGIYVRIEIKNTEFKIIQ